jgi:hypothetical protein
MDETPFFRLRLSPDDARLIGRQNQSADPEFAARVGRLLRFSFQCGCLPFGRLDEASVSTGGPVPETLDRTCTAVEATQRGYDFQRTCYVSPPVLDPWLEVQSAALLSHDGRFGLLIEHVKRGRVEEIVYSCTSRLADLSYVATRRSPPTLFDAPDLEAAMSPSAALKDLLAFHARRIVDRPVLPFTVAQVPAIVLALNRSSCDHNVAAGRFLPLQRRELLQIRAAMEGKSV